MDSRGADGWQDCGPPGSLRSRTSDPQSKNHWHIAVLTGLGFGVSSLSG